MKVFKIWHDVDNYRACFLEDNSIEDLINEKVNNGIRLDEIGNITFKYDDETNLPIGDICKCWGCSAYIINDKCYKVFESISEINAQYFTVGQNFIILNNLTVLSDLNLEKTEFRYFEDDIIGIKKYSFKKTDLPLLFQIKLPSGIVEMDYFVTEEFIKIVEENDLKGFLFEEVWDSEKE